MYTDRLELPMVHREVLEGTRVELAYLDAGNTLVQLVAPIEPRGFIHDHLLERGEGLHHLCFTVDDIDASLQEVGEEGTSISVGGRRCRVAFLQQHPEGVHIELTKREPQASDSGHDE